jgi:hypothetical protein
MFMDFTALLNQLCSLTTNLTEIASFFNLPNSSPASNSFSLTAQRKAYYNPAGSLCWHHFVFRHNAHRCSKFACSWRTGKTQSRLCFYHERFGRKARRCTKGCARYWQKLRNFPKGSSKDQRSQVTIHESHSSKQTVLTDVWTQTPRIHRCELSTQTRAYATRRDCGTQMQSRGLCVKPADVAVQVESAARCNICRLTKQTDALFSSKRDFITWLEFSPWQRRRMMAKGKGTFIVED